MVEAEFPGAVVEICGEVIGFDEAYAPGAEAGGFAADAFEKLGSGGVYEVGVCLEGLVFGVALPGVEGAVPEAWFGAEGGDAAAELVHLHSEGCAAAFPGASTGGFDDWGGR